MLTLGDESAMKLHAPLVLSLVFLLGADQSKEDAVKADLARFQGTWTVASMEMNGKSMPPEARQKIKLTLNGENFVFKNGDHSEPGLYKLDPAKKPKELNIVITEGEDKGKIYLVIYKIEGDTMTQCMELENKNRPREFTGKAGSGCALEVWQRQKP
jgi:uncharacterized protein (TIGR03067 family)